MYGLEREQENYIPLALYNSDYFLVEKKLILLPFCHVKFPFWHIIEPISIKNKNYMKEKGNLSEAKCSWSDRQKMGRDKWITQLLKSSPATKNWIVQ